MDACGDSSVAERQSPKLNVRGSIPRRRANWPVSVTVNMPPCHGGDYRFESGTGRH